MNFNEYVKAATRDPLLTPAEEIMCGNAVQEMLPLLEINSNELTRAQRRTIVRGKRAKERLIRGNLRLVISIAKKARFRGNLRHMYLDDLCQEGAIGLTRAAEKFDPKRGYKFSTYAYWWIRQAIMRSVQNQERAVRLPANTFEALSKVQKFIDGVFVAEGRVPTLEECADVCKVPVATLRPALNAWQRPSSLDAQVNSTDGSTLIDLIKDEAEAERALSSEWTEMWKSAKDALKRLPKEHSECLEHYYGLNDQPSMSLAALAKKEGISREAFRQRVARANLKMRIVLNIGKVA